MTKDKNNKHGIKIVEHDFEGNIIPRTMNYNPLKISYAECRRSFEDIGIKQGD